MSNVGQKKSEVWNYFSISVSDNKKAVCHECNENVARGGDKTNSFNTSNLRKHLKNRHPDKLRELEESEKAASKKKSQCPTTSKFLTSNARRLFRMVASLPIRPSSSTKDYSFNC